LCEAGVPIAAQTNKGYELLAGNYVPPLRFTAREAPALALSGRLMIAHTIGGATADAVSALDKILLALSAATRDLAIRERRLVWLRSRVYRDESAEPREIEPMWLNCVNGVWYVAAYCRPRQDRRSFRLNRVEAWRSTGRTFEPRTSGAGDAPEEITATLRVRGADARRVRERQHFGFAGEQPSGADILMRYRVRSVDERVVRRELLKDAEGGWMDIVHWSSQKDALAAAAAIEKAPAVAEFSSMLDFSILAMRHFEQVEIGD